MQINSTDIDFYKVNSELKKVFNKLQFSGYQDIKNNIPALLSLKEYLEIHLEPLPIDTINYIQTSIIKDGSAVEVIKQYSTSEVKEA